MYREREREREGDGSLFKSKILVKSPKPRNKAQIKVDYKNYDAITMSRNYEWKLFQEIMTGNYQLVSMMRKMREL